MNEIRVRFAPSPTGYLHIGGARTCLFNWLLARRIGGKLVLRIEDTDLERLKENSVEQILSSLKWLGMNWDEGPERGGEFGPYFQSQRMDIYKREAEGLVDQGKAYYCYCTSEELEERRTKAKEKGGSFKYDGRCKELSQEEKDRFILAGRKPVIRIKAPREGQTVVNDIIRGSVSFDNTLLDDIIIFKSNGMPTYNFACVIDDYSMEISHVIRAEEHLSNTPKQIIIYNALGHMCPQFAHVPMILAPDRSKLSKRHGATSVEEFRDQGFLPQAIVNYLCLLGWSTDKQDEIINLESAAAQFSLERVSKNAAIYDTKKLTWINGHYLKTLDIEYITKLTRPFMQEIGIDVNGVDKGMLKSIVNLVREKVWTLTEIAEGARFFFERPCQYEEKGVEKYFRKEGASKLLNGIKQKLKELDSFDKTSIETVYRSYAEELEIKAGELIHPTRMALTGKTVSPGLFEIMEVMGKDECVERMKNAIEFLVLGT
jgi:glutamyl-tRNA synthetase